MSATLENLNEELETLREKLKLVSSKTERAIVEHTINEVNRRIKSAQKMLTEGKVLRG